MGPQERGAAAGCRRHVHGIQRQAEDVREQLAPASRQGAPAGQPDPGRPVLAEQCDQGVADGERRPFEGGPQE